MHFEQTLQCNNSLFAKLKILLAKNIFIDFFNGLQIEKFSKFGFIIVVIINHITFYVLTRNRHFIQLLKFCLLN